MNDPHEFPQDVKGRVIKPGDPDYDALRAVDDGRFDSRPALIVRVADDSDVALVIEHARRTGLELAIISGGHSFAGHSATQGGILLDLRDRKTIEIDPDQRTAWADAGLTTGEVVGAAQAHDLVVGFGDTATVGVGGITLGGGMGYLVRKHGLTIDSLLAADVVTADGAVLRVDARNHPDLFWAIRGGGGNLGVVTRFKFQLHPLPACYCGFLVLPATAEVVAGFVDAAEQAPEELSAILNIMPAPPMPFLPKELHGRLVALGALVYAGDPDGGERAMAPFRALATPLADLVGPQDYATMFPPDEAGSSFHPTSTGHSIFLDAFDQESAKTIVARLEAAKAPMRVAELRVLGGAMARVPDDATAFAHRSRRMVANLVAFYEGAEEKAAREKWVAEFAAALRPAAGAYVNFLMSSGESETRRAYPELTWERLAEIKRQYDPGNLFRRNHNIPPAAGKR